MPISRLASFHASATTSRMWLCRPRAVSADVKALARGVICARAHRASCDDGRGPTVRPRVIGLRLAAQPGVAARPQLRLADG